MPKATLTAMLLIFMAGNAASQDYTLYQKKIFVDKGDTMPYRLLFPENYNPRKKYPLILFLHGSGEKGNDNAAQLLNATAAFLRDSIRKNYPAFVVVPQCAATSNWAIYNRVKDSSNKTMLAMPPDAPPTQAITLAQQLVKQLMHQYRVNSKRVYVGGLSLGGMGTYDIVKRNPALFAAAFPICGAADASIAPALKQVNWWIFHGADDNVVSPEPDKNMVAAMQQLNIPVQYTLYPGTGHNSWDKAMAEPGLFAWLFSNVKK